MKNTNADLDFWSELIKNIAIKVYKKVNPVLNTNKAKAVQGLGAGGDMTLYIDKMAEDIIIEELSMINVPLLLITEEKGEIILNESDIVSNSASGSHLDSNPKPLDVIIVDPIDGSHNAAFGFPFSAVSIAHAYGTMLSDVDCGVVINIFNGDVFETVKGRGSRFNGDIVSVNDNTGDNKIFFGINFSVDEPFRDYINRWGFLFNRPLRIRSIGSDALGVLYVGIGVFDIFINTKHKSRVLDIAVGYRFVLEAGGEFWSIECERLDAPLKVDSRVSFIALNKGLQRFIKSLKDKFIEANKNQPHYSGRG